MMKFLFPAGRVLLSGAERNSRVEKSPVQPEGRDGAFQASAFLKTAFHQRHGAFPNSVILDIQLRLAGVFPDFMLHEGDWVGAGAVVKETLGKAFIPVSAQPYHGVLPALSRQWALGAESSSNPPSPLSRAVSLTETNPPSTWSSMLPRRRNCPTYANA